MKTRTRTPRIATINGLERRSYASTLETDGGLEFKISGWASVVGEKYDMGAYDELVAPGAFTKTLAGSPDVQLLVNHEGLPLARTTLPPGQPGHLSLSEDLRGLRVDAQLDPDDPDARVLVTKIRSGLLDQMSFAFRVLKQSWNADNSVRTIEQLSLDRGDVSVVNFGASPTTSVDARSRPGTLAGDPMRDPKFLTLLMAAKAGGPTPRTDASIAAARRRQGAGNLSLAQAQARALRIRADAGRRW
jgi:HK97 family phage prohead protease